MNSSDLTPLYRLAGIFALLAVLWSVLMITLFNLGPVSYPFPHRFAYEIDSPILALELARSPRDIDAVLQNNNAGSAQAHRALFWNTVLDCVFIPLYSGYLILFGLSYQPRPIFRKVLTAYVIAVAVFDYLENTLMFLAVRGSSPPVFIPSTIKWLLLGLVLFLTTVLLLRPNPGPYSLSTSRLLGLVYLAAGALIFLGTLVFGAILNNYALLELGTKIFALTVLFNAVGLLARRRPMPPQPPIAEVPEIAILEDE